MRFSLWAKRVERVLCTFSDSSLGAREDEDEEEEEESCTRAAHRDLIFLAEAVREAVFFEEPLGRPLLFPEAPGVAFNGKVGLYIFFKKNFF